MICCDPLREETAEKTYPNVKHIINRIAYNFYNQCGGDLDEYISTANFCFVRSFNKWNPECGSSYSTFLHMIINYGLRDILRYNKKKFRNRFIPMSMFTDQNKNEEERYFDIEDPTRSKCHMIDLFESLSSEAQFVLNLLFEDFFYHRKDNNFKKGSSWRGLQTELRAILRDDFSWDKKKINNIFAEIKEAII